MFVQLAAYPNYLVSDKGEVLSWCRGAWLPMAEVNRVGYHCITLYKDGKARPIGIHRLVMLAFHGESDMFVDHLNGVKTDNRLENLEYVTPKENTRRAWANGLCEGARKAKQGTKNPQSKLSDLDRKYIMALKGLCSQSMVAKMFDVDQGWVSRMWNGKTTRKARRGQPNP